MSTPSTDGLKIEIDQGRMRIGNPVQAVTGLPAFTNVKQLTADASSNLQGTDAVTAVQPTATVEMFDVTGSGTTGLLTRTVVVGSDVTTATIGGYLRVKVTNPGTGLTSGSYYLPFYTIV